MNKLLTTLLFCSLTPNVIADTWLLNNINGYSVKAGQVTRFNAMQITDDKIDKIFQDTVETSKDIRIVDGLGKTVIPGLIDAHGHVLNYGLGLMSVELSRSKSEQDAVNIARQFSQQNKSDTWLLGRGWNQEKWQNKSFPSAASLNEYFKDTPVWFTRVDGHAGWANTKAMELAGITESSISPEGGQIIKDSNGQPTGVFIDNAMRLISNNIPPLTPEQIKYTLHKSMQTLASLGITSVHDAGVTAPVIKAYKEIAAESDMPIRVNAMIGVNLEENWLTLVKQGHIKTADDTLQINSVKISADGALGSRGAALIHDYSDMPGHKGLLLIQPNKLKTLMKTAMQHGFQVNTHAIGDNANHIVLNHYQDLIKETDTKNMRHRVEHAQVLKITDIPRFSELGVIASMQSTHATSDKNMAETRLGPERIKGAYAWRSLLNNNAIIAQGSDFPVESANPFYGIHAAVTRQDHQNQPENGWYGNERMTLVETIESFTYMAAYAAHQENIIGSLAAGKKADFVILEQDPFTIATEKLWQIPVAQTWVNGKQVF